MFQLYGFSADEAAKKATAVFLHETTLATFSKSRTELRDPQANYNKMTLAEFKENYPNIPLEALGQRRGHQERISPGDDRRSACILGRL